MTQFLRAFKSLKSGHQSVLSSYLWHSQAYSLSWCLIILRDSRRRTIRSLFDVNFRFLRFLMLYLLVSTIATKNFLNKTVVLTVPFGFASVALVAFLPLTLVTAFATWNLLLLPIVDICLVNWLLNL